MPLLLPAALRAPGGGYRDPRARVAKPADAGGLKPPAERRVGSTPTPGTLAGRLARLPCRSCLACPRTVSRVRKWLVVVAMMAVSAACSTETTATESRAISTPTTGESPAPTSATTAPTVADAPSDPTDPTDPSDLIDQLAIDDSPRPIRPYVRDDWPHWEDVDGDGCDARQQTLIAQSLTPAQVDPFGCVVVAGDWFSIYDGITSDQPSELDVDHVVALENAHTSGGWQWEADRRRHFANDPDNLLAVSSASNRSKGSSGPQEWRPPARKRGASSRPGGSTRSCVGGSLRLSANVTLSGRCSTPAAQLSTRPCCRPTVSRPTLSMRIAPRPGPQALPRSAVASLATLHGSTATTTASPASERTSSSGGQASGGRPV
jgi:hypothetical protein